MPKGTRIANPTGVSIESSKGKGLGTKLKKRHKKKHLEMLHFRLVNFIGKNESSPIIEKKCCNMRRLLKVL